MRVIRERTRGSDEFFEGGRWVHARHRHESIAVRLGATVDADILETAHGVVIARGDRGEAYVMDWRLRRNPVSTLAPFFTLLRARTAADGVVAMRALPEPALNVLFADDTRPRRVSLRRRRPDGTVVGPLGQRRDRAGTALSRVRPVAARRSLAQRDGGHRKQSS